MNERDNDPPRDTPVIRSPVEDDLDGNLPTTSAADVESAGRSCLVILVMAVIIVLLLLLWIVFGLTGGGGR